MHQGVFIDIFPLDRATERRKVLLWHLPRLCERLTAFSSAKLPRAMRFLLPVQMLWQGVFPASFWARCANWLARFLSNNGDLYVNTFSTIRLLTESSGFGIDLFEPAIRTKFEGVTLCIPNASGKILGRLYGDWNGLPQEDKRFPVHSAGGIVDVHKDYSFYINNH